MALENRDLAVGTVLTARYKGKERTAQVVETGDGVRYRLDDGTEHRSPSSAGKAAMDGVACNGWRWWSMAGEDPPKRERKAKGETKRPKTKKAAKKGKTAKKPKARAAAMKSRESYGCGACGATFGTMKAATQHARTHVD